MAAVAEAATPPAEAPAGRPRVVVRKDKTNPRRLAYLLLLLFAAPPGWPLLVLGAALVLAGVWFHGWAAGLLARAGYVESGRRSSRSGAPTATTGTPTTRPTS